MMKIVNFQHQRNRRFLSMKKIIILLIVVILLGGCQYLKLGNFGKLSAQGKVPPTEDYRKGDDGLTIKEITGMPPKEIFEGEEFTIGMELKNSGTEDVADAKVILSALNSLYFSPYKDERLVTLAGKSRYLPEGEQEIIEFRIVNLKLQYGAKEYTQPYIIELDYPYATIASTEVCINPNIYEHMKIVKDACDPTTISLNNQGAPVAVKKIKEYITSKGSGIYANYDIEISNIGDGKVTDEKIIISDAVVGIRDLECTPKEVKLKEKRGTFRCSTLIERSEGVYKSIFSVKLNYNYRSEHKGSIKVKE